MSEKKAFENNEVLLWGENPVKKSLLEQFDKGNKNPFSTLRKKEPKAIEEKKVPIKKTFTIGEDYGVQDLPFLNKEYERIDKEISKITDIDELDELSEIQDKLYDLIEGLEHLQKLGGRGLSSSLSDMKTNHDIKTNHYMEKIKELIGKGFKKGSPEAIAHAEKMRKILEEKNKSKGEKIVKKSISSKARVVKGSEEAKALGKRMAEAKKKKAEEAKKLKEMEEEEKPIETIKPKKGKPWFYIGDIPKGYREATEDEAILSKKVSYYGKYVVDSEKWRLYKDYDILLTDDKTNKEIEWSMNGLKRRVLEALKEIEILSSKLDNEKYHERWEEFSHKLENEKEKKKYLQAGYNWYYKLLCSRTGKKYERQKIELEKPKIKTTKSEPIEYKEPERQIDIRTGKPIEYGELYIDRIREGYEEPKKEIKNQKVDVDLWFEKEDNIITLSTKYFTPDYKLKPKYAKKLLDKNIVLKKKHYTTEDYNKYFYGMSGGGYGLIKSGEGIVERLPDIKKKYIIQSVLFDKKFWTINKAKKWLKDNGYFNDEIDEKENHFRFRQFNTDDLMERHYITEKINNGIELIISIK